MRISDWSSDVCSSDLPILCKVPNNVDTGSILVHYDSSAFLQHVEDMALTQISFTLRDDEGKEVDLNGLSWSSALEFGHLIASESHGKPMQSSEFFRSLISEKHTNGASEKDQEVRDRKSTRLNSSH